MHTPLPAWANSLHHAGAPQFVSNLQPSYNETVTLRIRVAENAPIKNIYLRLFPEGEQHIHPLRRETTQHGMQWWHTQITVTEPLTHYRFLIESEHGGYHYNGTGLYEYVPLDQDDFKLITAFNSPAWLPKTVFYQIFPDRFYNGDRSNDPVDGQFKRPGIESKTLVWNERPEFDNRPNWLLFYGGDLNGVIEKLDYLQALGVTALYFNPIFPGNSEHRYDVADYDQVDPVLGGDEALIALRQALDERDMRYILDIVPNHCGDQHEWLQTALQHHDSEERNFFFWENNGNDYASWLGHKSLPKLNYTSPTLRQKMYQADDAIMQKWLKPPFRADGWRVDVGNMLGRYKDSQLNTEVIREMRTAVKQANPDAYFVAENFFDFSPQSQGDQWDAVMNYTGFAIPLWHWLRGYRQNIKQGFVDASDDMIHGPLWSTAALAHSWQTRMAAIPLAVQHIQMNTIDSHDTERLLTLMGENENLMRLAAIVQFTFPGVPCIYYGDEIGMVNHPKLKQREPMPWDESQWNRDIFNFYKQLIALRKSTPALENGSFQLLAVGEQHISYLRETANAARIITIAQRDDASLENLTIPVSQAGIADGTVFTEYFSQQQLTISSGALTIANHPQGGSVWIEQSSN